MAKLRIYNDIDSKDNKFWYQWREATAYVSRI